MPSPLADFLERAGRVDRHRFAFNNAGARDQENLLIVARIKATQIHALATLGTVPS